MSNSEIGRSEMSRTAEASLTNGRVQEISLVKVGMNGAARGRAWRVTLGRLARRDGKPALVEGVADARSLYPSALYAYYAGECVTPGPLTRRSYPVWPTNGRTPFVEIQWGMAGGGTPMRLLANWPMLGGSTVVCGTDVEVWGGMDHRDEEDPELDNYPRFSAMIVPATGSDVGAELSLVQRVTVTGEAPGKLYVPDFARRVRFSGGPHRATFIDDNGTEVDEFNDTAGDRPDFTEVPQAATIVRIAGEIPTLFAHWRIAP